MQHTLVTALAGLIITGFVGAAGAQEVRLRGASFLPSNASFGVIFKRWADEVNVRGKGIVQIDVVGPEAVPTGEQPNAVKTGVVDLHSGPPTFYRGTMIEAEVMSLAEISIPEMKNLRDRCLVAGIPAIVGCPPGAGKG